MAVRKILLVGLAVVALTGVYGYHAYQAMSGVVVKAAAPTPAPFTIADAQTTSIVNAANAFLSTLGDEQKKATLFDFKDTTQRVNWSNFPLGGPGADRKGVKWGDLNGAQRAALTALLGTVLSPKGAEMTLEQVAADDIVATRDASDKAGQTSNGLPTVSFGSDYYFVSFVGAPSTTAPWMLQFGGHHLALNATVVCGDVTLSPSLTGGQPLKFTKDGKSIYIVADEVSKTTTMLTGLTDDQRTKMLISKTRIDLVLGPGMDGMTLQPQGLSGADMTDEQKTQFLALIQSRLDMLNADDLVTVMAPVKANINQTSLAWYGPTDVPGAAYVRVVGPTVVLEFSPQDHDGDPVDHVHSMYRDPTNEYGAAWTALKF
jgi:Protein of unknown function (DUF3500)